jgi:hypothetical protein
VFGLRQQRAWVDGPVRQQRRFGPPQQVTMKRHLPDRQPGERALPTVEAPRVEHDVVVFLVGKRRLQLDPRRVVGDR